jgi:hypothetical protein
MTKSLGKPNRYAKISPVNMGSYWRIPMLMPDSHVTGGKSFY